mmetsp:Transcript_12974/g.31654  ORF Transcript_12974/g.31654 Transcript_12974/m.31654 type:complete len:1170 (-) Transcript_12974:257-3766(-)
MEFIGLLSDATAAERRRQQLSRPVLGRRTAKKHPPGTPSKTKPKWDNKFSALEKIHLKNASLASSQKNAPDHKADFDSENLFGTTENPLKRLLRMQVDVMKKEVGAGDEVEGGPGSATAGVSGRGTGGDFRSFQGLVPAAPARGKTSSRPSSSPRAAKAAAATAAARPRGMTHPSASSSSREVASQAALRTTGALGRSSSSRARSSSTRSRSANRLTSARTMRARSQGAAQQKHQGQDGESARPLPAAPVATEKLTREMRRAKLEMEEAEADLEALRAQNRARQERLAVLNAGRSSLLSPTGIDAEWMSGERYGGGRVELGNEAEQLEDEIAGLIEKLNAHRNDRDAERTAMSIAEASVKSFSSSMVEAATSVDAAEKVTSGESPSGSFSFTSAFTRNKSRNNSHPTADLHTSTAAKTESTHFISADTEAKQDINLYENLRPENAESRALDRLLADLDTEEQETTAAVRALREKLDKLEQVESRVSTRLAHVRNRSDRVAELRELARDCTSAVREMVQLAVTVSRGGGSDALEDDASRPPGAAAAHSTGGEVESGSRRSASGCTNLRRRAAAVYHEQWERSREKLELPLRKWASGVDNSLLAELAQFLVRRMSCSSSSSSSRHSRGVPSGDPATIAARLRMTCAAALAVLQRKRQARRRQSELKRSHARNMAVTAGRAREHDWKRRMNDAAFAVLQKKAPATSSSSAASGHQKTHRFLVDRINRLQKALDSEEADIAKLMQLQHRGTNDEAATFVTDAIQLQMTEHLAVLEHLKKIPSLEVSASQNPVETEKALATGIPYHRQLGESKTASGVQTDDGAAFLNASVLFEGEHLKVQLVEGEDLCITMRPPLTEEEEHQLQLFSNPGSGGAGGAIAPGSFFYPFYLYTKYDSVLLPEPSSPGQECPRGHQHEEESKMPAEHLWRQRGREIAALVDLDLQDLENPEVFLLGQETEKITDVEVRCRRCRPADFGRLLMQEHVTVARPSNVKSSRVECVGRQHCHVDRVAVYERDDFFKNGSAPQWRHMLLSVHESTLRPPLRSQYHIRAEDPVVGSVAYCTVSARQLAWFFEARKSGGAGGPGEHSQQAASLHQQFQKMGEILFPGDALSLGEKDDVSETQVILPPPLPARLASTSKQGDGGDTQAICLQLNFRQRGEGGKVILDSTKVVAR